MSYNTNLNIVNKFLTRLSELLVQLAISCLSVNHGGQKHNQYICNSACTDLLINSDHKQSV